MRLTKRSSLAIRLLMYCAANPGRLVTKTEVAERCEVSENHLAQVVNRLGQIGYLETRRGRHGGLCLGRPAEAIRIGALLREVEPTPGDHKSCLADGAGDCPFLSLCGLKDHFCDALEAFHARLDGVTIADLVYDNQALERRLTYRPAAA
jgi:Rrf2 family nitric oxide-sensitive transcriptional repressor